MRRAAAVVALVVGLVIAVFFTAVAPGVERLLNRVTTPGPYTASAVAESLHRGAFVVDLHGDALLWRRDLTQLNGHGHIDLPRLRAGHVTLQVFSVVTKTPRGLNYERNSGESDLITLLSIAQRNPVRTWFSLRDRALYQAERLHDLIDREPRLALIRGRDAMIIADSSFAKKEARTFAILATEGLQPLEGELGNLDSLWNAGFRIFGLTHFFDNEVGGSAHGVDKGGLTPFGRRVIARLDSLGGIVDLAHASPRLFDDVLAATPRPVIVSHTGVQGTCPGPRNLSDDQLRRIAQRRGVVGIGFWDGAICDPTPAAFARAVLHAVQVAGDDAIAIGSDFDGSTVTPFDASGLARATESLLDVGLTPRQIENVLGANALRVLRELLPAR
jgi:microsomal dipeptidase-like Zn-dependent dipeptidase